MLSLNHKKSLILVVHCSWHLKSQLLVYRLHYQSSALILFTTCVKLPNYENADHGSDKITFFIYVFCTYSPMCIYHGKNNAGGTFRFESRIVELVRNLMAHAQKRDFVFRLNGRVHLNRRGSLFSRLLAAEVCASALVMLDTLRPEATHSIRQFPLHFPSRASPCATTFRTQYNAIDCVQHRLDDQT